MKKCPCDEPKDDDEKQYCLCVTSTKTEPVADEFEMYNLTEDPLETKNLANLKFETPETEVVKVVLANMLQEQCKQKRIYPSSGNVPGKPSCKSCAPKLIYK